MLATLHGVDPDALCSAWAVYHEVIKGFEHQPVPFQELVLHLNAGDFKCTGKDSLEGVLLALAGHMKTVRVIVVGYFDDCQKAKSTMAGWSTVFPLLRSRRMIVVEFRQKIDIHSN